MLALVAGVAVAAVRRTRPLVERKPVLLAFQTVVFLCLAMGILKMVRS